jgi:hypothetical protein
MRTFDDEIARHLQQTLDSGELRLARDFGKPFRDDPGWEATPPALRLPMQILKNAGALPPEVELFHERARVRAQLQACADPAERTRLLADLALLEQRIAVRLELLQASARF